MAETVDGFEVTGWLALGVPRPTPDDIVARLESLLSAFLREPATAAKLAEFGAAPSKLGAAELAARIADDMTKWSQVVAFAGLRKH